VSSRAFFTPPGGALKNIALEHMDSGVVQFSLIFPTILLAEIVKAGRN